jgi:RNA-binding protein
MLTGKQKRYLRALASEMDAIFQIGKGGLNENLIKQVDETLEVRELIKIKILQNSAEDVYEAAEEVATKTKAELVQVIGKNFVLFRQSEKKPKVELP